MHTKRLDKRFEWDIVISTRYAEKLTPQNIKDFLDLAYYDYVKVLKVKKMRRKFKGRMMFKVEWSIVYYGEVAEVRRCDYFIPYDFGFEFASFKQDTVSWIAFMEKLFGNEYKKFEIMYQEE